MAYYNQEDEIECEIIKSFGVFSQGLKGWNKEVNLVSWNGRPAKLDIRNWQTGHAKCGKGITLTTEEAAELVKLLNAILGSASTAESYGGEHSSKRRSSQKPGARQKTASSESFYSNSDYSQKKEFTGNSETGKKAGNKSFQSKNVSSKNTPSIPLSLKPFYDELKLKFGSGPMECKTARNTLLKKYHPDMHTGSSAFATGKTIKIKEAYEKISDWWKANKK